MNGKPTANKPGSKYGYLYHNSVMDFHNSIMDIHNAIMAIHNAIMDIHAILTSILIFLSMLRRSWNWFCQINIFSFLLAAAANCRFGDAPCPFPCHCEGDVTCDEVTGDCGDAGCDNGNLGGTTLQYTEPWRGPGCQIGEYYE